MSKKDRTFIYKTISKMLDNPDEHGIHPTTEAYDALEHYMDGIRVCEAHLDTISKHPSIAFRVGVGDGSVKDAVIAVCGALECAEQRIAALAQDRKDPDYS